MRFATTLAALAAFLLAAPASAGPAAASAEGLWMNPHGSVAVRTGPCGDKLCGWIIWANAEAQQDARDSGVPRLIGTELLEDYRPESSGGWAGTVFVPDMGKRFYSELRLLSPTQLKVKGCILGGLICKSQTWTRIARVPQ